MPTYAVIRETVANAAEPIAKPLPIAAVVLPTESSLSVITRTSGARWQDSARPPALSAIGPNASIETVAPTKASIPRADIAIPYVPQMIPETTRAIPMRRIGARQEREPIASPLVITKLSPSFAISASSFVGLKSALV